MVAKKKESKKSWTLDKVLPWMLVVGGSIGVLASLLLTKEVFNRLENPAFSPICNLNPVLNCTSVADSSQSHVFGFPNYFIGIAGYAVLATVGFAMLAGAKFKRWFWLAVEGGLLFSMAFITWLQFQTLYRIGALCIFCMIVWAISWPMFWYTTLYNLREGHIKTPTKLEKIVAFSQRHHGDILIVWYVVIIALILKRFWYYWSTLI